MPKKYRLIQAIVDPSSDQISMSRLLIGVLIILFLPIMLVLEAVGVHFTMWAQFALIVGSIAGIYFGNSAVRVWRGRVIEGPKPGG